MFDKQILSTSLVNSEKQRRELTKTTQSEIPKVRRDICFGNGVMTTSKLYFLYIASGRSSMAQGSCTATWKRAHSYRFRRIFLQYHPRGYHIIRIAYGSHDSWIMSRPFHSHALSSAIATRIATSPTQLQDHVNGGTGGDIIAF
jgi:hypothetical protein